MSGIRRFGAIAVACATLLMSLAIGAAAAAPRFRAHVQLTGLSSPKGLTIGTDGNPIVGQGAFGPPGPILQYVRRGPDRGTTVELFGPVSISDLATAPDGTGWAIGGDQVLYRRMLHGTVEPVLDIAAYQVGDPDPVDQEGRPGESNPYGLAALPDGDALLTDAANNDLLRVTPEGIPTTVARLDVQETSTAHLPPGFPPTLTAEAVPTTVAVGPDGFAYVGELKGFPFRPRTSHVWRIDPDAEGALCSVTTPDPDCSVYRGGFTAIQDIAFNQNNGRLFVYELAAGGVLAFEEGFETGEFPPAVLLKVKKNKSVKMAAGQLSQPGGVAVAPNGHVWVTDGMFSDGRLLRIRA